MSGCAENIKFCLNPDCGKSGSYDDMYGCHRCRSFLCAACEHAEIPCNCFKINMVLCPDKARRYYALLDTENRPTHVTKKEYDALERELEELEQHLDTALLRYLEGIPTVLIQ